jgi:3-hydroxyisobutyrate dehydrogenase-like beta-hydroxyacid dehydrogenase
LNPVRRSALAIGLFPLHLRRKLRKADSNNRTSAALEGRSPMTTIAIIAPGAMGSAIGRRLTQNGARVLTSLKGRSAGSVARAEQAAMRDVEPRELIEQADFFLSIVPPKDAGAVAAAFASWITEAEKSPLYVDCNAIAVPEVERIGAIVERAGGRFVDGCIIGLPPVESGRGPTLYFSGSHAHALQSLDQLGLVVRCIDGSIGAATALKLSYAGINKGITAIAAAMILAAERAGAGDGFRAELAASQPELLSKFQKAVPDMFPKAYRWVEEMRAIEEFVGAAFPESRFYEGAAGLFERLAREDAEEERRRLGLFLSEP